MSQHFFIEKQSKSMVNTKVVFIVLIIFLIISNVFSLHSIILILLIMRFIVFRQYSVDYKLETYLKIARLYLEVDDPVQAEAFVNRASLLQAETTNEQLQIYYKVCYARVLDYRR